VNVDDATIAAGDPGAVIHPIGWLAIARNETSNQVRGECPLHEPSEAGKHPSFSAHLGRKMFQCFKCGASGNQLDLWAKKRKQSAYEAAVELCARLNKETPWLTSGPEKRNP
jgi:DNA primase